MFDSNQKIISLCQNLMNQITKNICQSKFNLTIRSGVLLCLSLFIYVFCTCASIFSVAGIFERYVFEPFGFILRLMDDYLSIRKYAALASDMGTRPSFE